MDNKLNESILDIEATNSIEEDKERKQGDKIPLVEPQAELDNTKITDALEMADNAKKINLEEQQRRQRLQNQLEDQFRLSGDKYLYKDQNKIAFKDKGTKAVSSSNDQRVALAMVTLAESKGWQAIKVSGHPDFKRIIWLEAKSRGLEVSGYKPTEKELAELDTRLEKGMKNSIEQSSSQEQTIQEKAIIDNPIEHNEQNNRHFTGTLLEHGSAPYLFEKNNKQNYFAKVKIGDEVKDIWGIDIKRAIKESKSEINDKITIEFQGNQPVIVKDVKKDKQGKIISITDVETIRNTWSVEVIEKAKTLDIIAKTVIAQNVKNPEHQKKLQAAINKGIDERYKMNILPVPMLYDKDAPRQQKLPERDITLDKERTR